MVPHLAMFSSFVPKGVCFPHFCPTLLPKQRKGAEWLFPFGQPRLTVPQKKAGLTVTARSCWNELWDPPGAVGHARDCGTLPGLWNPPGAVGPAQSCVASI